MTPDAWGHIGYALLFAGMWLIGSGRRCGWFVRAAGTALWLGIGLWIGMTSVWMWGIPMLAADLNGARRAFRA